MNASSQLRHRRRSSAAFFESSWLRLIVIELIQSQDAKNRKFGNTAKLSHSRYVAQDMAHRLPALVSIAEEVPYGLLMSYGQNYPDFFRRSATYIDKILKGAKASELPVEQPTKFKLVLNLKTTKALGLTFPQTLVVSADQLIE